MNTVQYSSRRTQKGVDHRIAMFIWDNVCRVLATRALIINIEVLFTLYHR